MIGLVSTIAIRPHDSTNANVLLSHKHNTLDSFKSVENVQKALPPSTLSEEKKASEVAPEIWTGC